MRQAYIVHVLDHVLAERSTISWNDRSAEEEELAEEQGGNTKVTLENVFELAKQKETDNKSENSSSEDGEDDHEDRGQ